MIEVQSFTNFEYQTQQIMNFKKMTTMPGFELLFAVSIAAIFILPATVFAQDTRNLDISISNGDTVINGKNIKDLKGKERQQALNDINKIQAPHSPRGAYRFERSFSDGPGQKVIIERKGDEWVMGNARDTLQKQFHLRRIDADTTIAFNSNQDDRGFFDIPEHREMLHRGDRDLRGSMRMFPRRNTQSFTFENTDNNGTTTRISYRVSNVRPQWGFGDRHSDDHAEDKKDELNLSNIRMTADFGNGKTTLSFDLPAKTTAQAILTDSNDKTIWSEKIAGGSFSKSFIMPLNGRYHLTVKQGAKAAEKEIFKEE